ncbi:MAG: OprO/OprP family phosphate-selective porin [Pseudomonadales bacterium]|nr:OprO/OprP family phosphate-selective porin [Pseudomonadales bacterium]
MTRKFRFIRASVLSTLSVFAGLEASQAASVDELANTLKQQQQQIDALTTALEQQTSSPFSNTSLGGYGEHHFSHSKKGDDVIDIHRYVLFISHQYSDSIEFISEFEIEHGLVNDTADGSGVGEVEIEQAYIQWQINADQTLKIGQFLVPVGTINETHEPDTFYGVERNPVEAKIIPTTWWEAGVMNSGIISDGLSYDVAFQSGLSTTSTNIRSGRQKNAKASAETWALTGRLKYTGIKGLEIASTLNWQQDLSQGTATESAEASLLEIHAIYTSGSYSIKALHAMWNVDGDIAEADGKDEQTGSYIEPQYKVTDKLGLFARYSIWDNAAGNNDDTETTQYDIGLNYWLADRVVLKADWQDQDNANSSSEKDGFNIGVGWSF